MPEDFHRPLETFLVLGAAGGLGSSFCRKLKQASYTLIGMDLSEPALGTVDRFIPGNVTDSKSLALLHQTPFDGIVVAVPGPLAQAVVAHVIEPYGQDALVVDLFSEKKPFYDGMQDAGLAVEYVGVHTLFGPRVGWEGQNVIITPRDVTGARGRAFIEDMATWGANLRHADIDEHDQLMGVIQVAVHATILLYAQFFAESSLDFELLDAISTPSSRVMWAMIARMMDIDPNVYWEIQAMNTSAEGIRNRLAQAIDHLNQIVNTGDKDTFLSLFDSVNEILGEESEKYKQLARRLYSHEI